MKIFSPLTNQSPLSSCTARQRSAAMSEPASGSVMSMQPHASPATISSIICRNRVSTIRPVSASISVLPSRSEKTSAAIAIPPWKP